MDKFTEIINTYVSNYDKYEHGKTSFECEYGELIFNKENKNTLTLFGIYIQPQFRENGLCRDIFYYVIDNCHDKFKYFCVQDVLSKILYEYLLRFKYKGTKFINTKNGFIYKMK
jgi:hypothetical protein